MNNDAKLIVSDERVRAIRNRVWASLTRLDIALRTVDSREAREELYAIKTDLLVSLAYIGGEP